jgi:hypothetical protein
MKKQRKRIHKNAKLVFTTEPKQKLAQKENTTWIQQENNNYTNFKQEHHAKS